MSPLSQPLSWCVPQVPCRRLHHDSQFKVSTGQTSARYAGKCLTDSLRKKKKAPTVAFGNFCGINILTMVNFKLLILWHWKWSREEMHPKGSPRWCKPAPACCRVEQIWGTLLRNFPNSSCVNKDKQLPVLKYHCRFKWFPQVCLSFISSCLRLACCLILILLWILQFLIS